MAEVTLPFTELDMSALGWRLPTTGIIVRSDQAEDETVVIAANTSQEVLEEVLASAGYHAKAAAGSPVATGAQNPGVRKSGETGPKRESD